MELKMASAVTESKELASAALPSSLMVASIMRTAVLIGLLLLAPSIVATKSSFYLSENSMLGSGGTYA